MKALITGANGYIASHIISTLLQQKHKVIALIRPQASLELLEPCKDKIEFAYYDGTFDSLRQVFLIHRPDVIFHMASCFIAEHQYHQIDTLHEANIKFGLHLLEAMKEAGVNRLINTGTSWQYYDSESAQYNPVCLYAATKQAFEDLAYYYYQAHDFSVINVILYDTYGPHDSRKKLFWLFKQAAQSQQAILMSPGEQKLDLVFIDDVVSAYLCVYELMANNPKQFSKYAVKTKLSYSLRTIAQLYEEIMAVKLNIAWAGRTYRKREVMLPNTKLETPPNWRPLVDLAQGLKLLQKQLK